MLALLVVLMACVFSTLDNAVTLRHAGGTDIGQWPACCWRSAASPQALSSISESGSIWGLSCTA